jgi:hypothetical protein
MIEISYKKLNDKVFEVRTITTETQSATEEREIKKYHTKLTTDKTSILADGIDTATITATVYNYLGELQTTFTDPIIFEYDGQQISVTPVNGVASIDFTSKVAGEYVVRTVNSNIRNGEVIIHV